MQNVKLMLVVGFLITAATSVTAEPASGISERTRLNQTFLTKVLSVKIVTEPMFLTGRDGQKIATGIQVRSLEVSGKFNVLESDNLASVEDKDFELITDRVTRVSSLYHKVTGQLQLDVGHPDFEKTVKIKLGPFQTVAYIPAAPSVKAMEAVARGHAGFHRYYRFSIPREEDQEAAKKEPTYKLVEECATQQEVKEKQ